MEKLLKQWSLVRTWMWACGCISDGANQSAGSSGSSHSGHNH
ncbi:MAG: hypothetical protein ACI9HK_005600 [Pirellulaceae bacterium]|jgi:hypothetical protein